MKLRCVKTNGRNYMTVGRIYEGVINSQWYDFFTESDKSYNENGEYIILPENERYGSGLPIKCFEFVSGTPEEKALWDYCEENGIDGL